MFTALTHKLETHHIADTEDNVVADDDTPAQASDDEDDAPDKANRTYSIVINNTSGLPLQVSAWPVRATTHSDYLLSSFRGTDFHSSVPPNGTVSTAATFHLGDIRGPKHLDPRQRWGWLFFDLVKADQTKIHLQAFIKVSRKGVTEALLGRTDLDANVKAPMSSGTVGEGVVEGQTVTFAVGEDLRTLENVVDDSTKAGIKDIPGKGIDTASYVSYKLARASLLVGSEARYHEYQAPVPPSRLSSIKHSFHEVEGVGSRYIGAFVENDGKGWWNGHVKVHPLTGVAKGNGFDSTAETTAVFGNNSVINYGFHDAGEGRHDQVYVYATPDRGSWLGDLIAENPAWLQVPFSKLALPAAHDSGMFGPLDPGLALLIQKGQLGNAIANHAETTIATPVVHIVVEALEEVKLKPDRGESWVINNIALTQKDSFKDQLHIGVRFFDFRPGFCFHDVIHAHKGRIHHQHAVVPGCTYLTFLTSVLDFLGDHPSEIVFVELKSDGFVVHQEKIKDGQVIVYSMIPSLEELAAVLDEARVATSDAGRKVEIASAADLDKPIGELIQSNKRFIIVDHVHDPDAWQRADSYDHLAYNTDNPATIIAALEKTFAESSHAEAPLPGKPLRGAIYQLQATPTANIKDDVRASFTYSDSSSLLTFMKPQMDRATYPWIASHTFNDPGNVIFLNDFVEGVLVEHAVEVSRQRAGL